MRKETIAVVSLAFLCLVVAGCLGGGMAGPAGISVAPSTVDYSRSENWLALPSPGDISKAVDVFYVYPTEYFAGPKGPVVSTIDHPGMKTGAQFAFAKQATAFAAIGNIFAPYYRQADAVYALSLTPIDAVYTVIGGAPESDVTAAFDYYIRHYNNGRPFILASHSQGSTVVALLLKDYMKDHPQVYRRMVAAYAIGWSFTPDYFDQNPHVRFAQNADDTGVIISYNTQGSAFAGRNPVVFPGAMAINPITWTRTKDLAPAAQNMGSLLLDATGAVVLPAQPRVMNFADAQVTTINPTTSEIDPSSGTSIVLCRTVDTAALQTKPIGPGFYHNYDYPFYYANIAANAANRVKRFLAAGH
jgi:hypothetical protein